MKYIFAIFFILFSIIYINKYYYAEPIIAYRVPKPNPNKTSSQATTEGFASYYDNSYCLNHNPNCIMANGQKFNDQELTAACAKRWKLGSVLRIYYHKNFIDIVCTDRGGFESLGRIIDLSKASFLQLAEAKTGVIKVKIKKIR